MTVYIIDRQTDRQPALLTTQYRHASCLVEMDNQQVYKSKPFDKGDKVRKLEKKENEIQLKENSKITNKLIRNEDMTKEEAIKQRNN